VADRAALHHRTAVDVVPHLDGARLGRVATQISQSLQRVEVAVDGGRRGEPHGVADLSDRRRIAAFADLLFDELENASLTRTDRGGHANSVVIRWRPVKHLYPEQLFEKFGFVG
jgi:hypothetical protein